MELRVSILSHFPLAYGAAVMWRRMEGHATRRGSWAVIVGLAPAGNISEVTGNGETRLATHGCATVYGCHRSCASMGLVWRLHLHLCGLHTLICFCDWFAPPVAPSFWPVLMLLWLILRVLGVCVHKPFSFPAALQKFRALPNRHGHTVVCMYGIPDHHPLSGPG